MDNQLITYIESAKNQGKTPEEIKNILLNSGWQGDVVDKVLVKVFPQTIVPTIANSPNQLDTSQKKLPVLKIIAISLISIIVLGATIIFFFPQIYLSLLINLQFPKSKYPAAYLNPSERIITVDKYSEFQELDYPGIKFKVPWKETPKINQKGDFKAFQFPFSGILLAIGMPDKNADVLKSFLEGDSQKINQIEATMGKDVLSSHYNFFKGIYNSSPPQISLIANKQESGSKSVLFGLKVATVFSNATNGFYSFSINNYKGFQMGNPDVGSIDHKATFIELFDNKDQRYEISFGGKNLTQADIDFILSSIQSSN